MRRRYPEEDGRFDGMSDGEERTVETPFGEVLFQFVEGDRSVGLNSGVVAVGLEVNGHVFDRAALEAATSSNGCSLAYALEQWAETQ